MLCLKIAGWKANNVDIMQRLIWVYTFAQACLSEYLP